MNVIFALQPLPRSIFLAGPTPRSTSVPSWRPEALSILRRHRFDGTVFVPESEGWNPRDNYDGQVEWEWGGIERASVVAFWVPRDIEVMPAFTTNIEFGFTVASLKTLLGFPLGTPKTGYLEALAARYHTPVYHGLEELLCAAMAKS